MNSKDKRKKQVKKAQLGFIILLGGLSVALLANFTMLFGDGIDYSVLALIAILIGGGLLISYFVITAQGRAHGKRFKAFRTSYPVSYLCQPDLVMSKRLWAIAKDKNDLVVFDVTDTEYKELLRMPTKDMTITPAEVSQNGMRKFIGLQVTSGSDEARFVLLNDKSALLIANSSQSYAEEAAKQLLS